MSNKFGINVFDDFTSQNSYAKAFKTILTVRVKDIILDNTHEDFESLGGWNSIGTIFYESTKSPIFSKSSKHLKSTAIPLFPNIKHYPLINEVVVVIFSADNDITENSANIQAYYLPPTNVWNSQFHNAIPSTNVLPESQKRDYKEIEGGLARQVTDNKTDIELGTTFNENNGINNHPLLPYEGDIIYEGRWGNSIRFGSTVKDAKIKNEWSRTGDNGSPITIIRNGQADYSTNSWEPVTEQINGDLSDIWLTSTQQLPIVPGSNLTDSYAKSKAPEDPREYSKNQIALNSGRLTFNAKDDAIILGAKKTIHLTADDSVNIDANKYIALTAPKVYLGSSQGIEGVDLQSVVLGEELNYLLGDIAAFLGTLNIAFSTATDSMGVPIASLAAIACDPQTLSQDILQQVNSKKLLSKQVKTSK